MSKQLTIKNKIVLSKKKTKRMHEIFQTKVMQNAYAFNCTRL